jgi:hypothetical protein
MPSTTACPNRLRSTQETRVDQRGSRLVKLGDKRAPRSGRIRLKSTGRRRESIRVRGTRNIGVTGGIDRDTGDHGRGLVAEVSRVQECRPVRRELANKTPVVGSLICAIRGMNRREGGTDRRSGEIYAARNIHCDRGVVHAGNQRGIKQCRATRVQLDDESVGRRPGALSICRAGRGLERGSGRSVRIRRSDAGDVDVAGEIDGNRAAVVQTISAEKCREDNVAKRVEFGNERIGARVRRAAQGSQPSPAGAASKGRLHSRGGRKIRRADSAREVNVTCAVHGYRRDRAKLRARAEDA